MKKKLFVVSDIHGHYTLLRQALEKAGFIRNNPQHLLICCGDCFDRGCENFNVLSFLDRINNKVIIRGNHEEMLIKIIESGRLELHNFINGADITVSDFFGRYCIDKSNGNLDFSGKTQMVNRVSDFLSETIDYFETEKYIFTHGWLPNIYQDGKMLTDKNWRHASFDEWKKARWTKWTDMYRDSKNLITGKTVVCGHYPTFCAEENKQKGGKENFGIFYGNGVIALDAGTYTSGVINVLVVDDEMI